MLEVRHEASVFSGIHMVVATAEPYSCQAERAQRTKELGWLGFREFERVGGCSCTPNAPLLPALWCFCFSQRVGWGCVVSSRLKLGFDGLSEATAEVFLRIPSYSFQRHGFA